MALNRQYAREGIVSLSVPWLQTILGCFSGRESKAAIRLMDWLPDNRKSSVCAQESR